MTLNVHLLYDYTPEVTDRLRAQLDPNIRLTIGEEQALDGDIHILIAGRPRREILAANENLHTLIVPWTGIPPETRDLLADFPGIALHNLHHNAPPVAEMAVALLLAAAKNIVPADQALRRGDWTIRYERTARSLLLEGKTLLILGYGEIGWRVARICQAMGMNVIAMKRQVTGEDNPFVEALYPPEKLHELLPLAHAVVVTLPLTQETEDLIGERELAILPDNAVLVNIGRGPIINEEALYQALKSGRLGAAGLDVWYNYPTDEASRTQTYPSDNPLWELDNLVMSPHRAGSADEIDYLRMQHLAILLNAAAKNDCIPNRVNLQRGY